MYRIDENTYIDDTLITCAEYQLFIDEMHRPGKYHHPDHWTTHQFPAGQARTPITGVRPADAQAFCVWLSQRQRGAWNYRVPTLQEALAYPLKSLAPTPLGYWLSQNEFKRFAWNGSPPTNPRALTLGFDYFLKIDPALDLNRTQNRAKNLDFSRVQTRTHAQEIIRHLGGVHGRAFHRILSRADDLDRRLIQALDHDLSRPRHSDNANILSLDISHQRARDLMSARQVIHARYKSDPIVRAIIVDLNRTLDIILYIYFDTLTLQERIAGRSPAFESIRIVKERVK